MPQPSCVDLQVSELPTIYAQILLGVLDMSTGALLITILLLPVMIERQVRLGKTPSHETGARAYAPRLVQLARPHRLARAYNICNTL